MLPKQSSKNELTLRKIVYDFLKFGKKQQYFAEKFCVPNT